MYEYKIIIYYVMSFMLDYKKPICFTNIIFFRYIFYYYFFLFKLNGNVICTWIF